MIAMENNIFEGYRLLIGYFFIMVGIFMYSFAVKNEVLKVWMLSLSSVSFLMFGFLLLIF